MMASICAAGLSQAALIASESFWTFNGTPVNGEYKQGIIAASNLSGYDNTIVTAGNSGFTAGNPWQGVSSLIIAYSTTIMNHNGVTGSAADGAARINVKGSLGDRQSNRLAASVPTASSYFMSALVRGLSSSLTDGDAGTIGFMSEKTENTFDISSGIHVGLNFANGKPYIAAFANNNTYDLVDLSVAGLTSVYQVVVRLDVNASGNDILSVWYAKNGDSTLTQAVANQDIGNIWASSADLDTLVIQSKVSDPLSSEKNVAYVDEVRFGTAMSDVTAIPEPMTIGLFGICGTGIFTLRRMAHL